MSGSINYFRNYNGLGAALYDKQVTMVRVEGYGFGVPSYEHITQLAGPGWLKTRAQVVQDIIAGTRYYVQSGLSPRVYLEVMAPIHLNGSYYVRTTPDYTTANNLLRLPRF